MSKRRLEGCIALLVMGVFASVHAQQPASKPVARLQETLGTVLVSQGEAMVAGTKDQQLPLGTRVITTANAGATIAFANGCIVKLGENKRFVVVDQDKCSAIAPTLGKASTFAVIGASSVVNTGSTIIDGDLGVSPGKIITGFPQGIVNEGKIHAADALANEAHDDAVKAYKELATQKCSVNLAGQDLGGLSLTPGVYCFPSNSAALTGELLLDNGGDPTAVYVFQIDGSLNAAAKSSVRVVAGGRPAPAPAPNAPQSNERKRSLQDCNIYWQVGGTVTLGAGTRFVGNIFATSNVGAAIDATVLSGRAVSLNGAVTMNTNAIDSTVCFPPAGAVRGVEALAAPALLGGAVIYGITRPTGSGSPTSVSPN